MISEWIIYVVCFWDGWWLHCDSLVASFKTVCIVSILPINVFLMLCWKLIWAWHDVNIYEQKFSISCHFKAIIISVLNLSWAWYIYFPMDILDSVSSLCNGIGCEWALNKSYVYRNNCVPLSSLYVVAVFFSGWRAYWWKPERREAWIFRRSVGWIKAE